MSRTSEIRQMSIFVRPSIDPAGIGGSPARGTRSAHSTHSAHGTLGLPGAAAAVGAALAPAARRHGA
ncbi:hypothetical protein [Streptomyces virginiae]|uniref:hypothetical protein n=1 Tax=Streptomyces virginiae TaxID=1961 RepID=UPI00386E6577|nr:hypothetical protein OG253_35850 [Streptomyces virginiae]